MDVGRSSIKPRCEKIIMQLLRITCLHAEVTYATLLIWLGSVARVACASQTRRIIARCNNSKPVTRVSVISLDDRIEALK